MNVRPFSVRSRVFVTGGVDRVTRSCKLSISAYTRGVSLRGCNVRRTRYVSRGLFRGLLKYPLGVKGSGGRHVRYNYVRDVSVNMCGAYQGNYGCYCTGCGGTTMSGGSDGRSICSPVLIKGVVPASGVDVQGVGSYRYNRLSFSWDRVAGFGLGLFHLSVRFLGVMWLCVGFLGACYVVAIFYRRD